MSTENRKIDRNEPCPCGSGRKYKHCFLYSKVVCINKAEELFEKIIGYEGAAMRELDALISSASGQPPRLSMICAFAVLDVFANNDAAYHDESLTPKKRFYRYAGEYLLTEKNHTYNRIFILRGARIQSDNLLGLRNGLTHYLGPGKDNKILLANEKMRNEKSLTQRENDLVSQGYVVVYPKDFYLMMFDSLKLFYNKVAEDVENDPTLFQEGIIRVFERVCNEGGIISTLNQEGDFDRVV